MGRIIGDVTGSHQVRPAADAPRGGARRAAAHAQRQPASLRVLVAHAGLTGSV